ncbi:peptidylprolyl isomerase [Pyxidicoccus xibeiensis]|uniref:peptidylprolyl isomerase n=1 Tax=Pyxidicoccus xibeiensis TaxID=2906759 RepID=UPI0020A821C0|nr:peptidylprolyl isomerase [Pyxidicoccus xibeiensis]MCP3145198.1 peptidylprolyl isomerase [Pyxidicoccus xibeiensis]
MSRLRTAGAPSALLAVLVLSSACVRAVPDSLPDTADAASLARIQAWEDRRSLGDGALVSLATGAPEARVRARALRALARIQDPATLDAVRAGLKDAEPDVRDEAAFAAGELALAWEPLTDAERASLAEALLEAEGNEREARVRAILFDALGRTGTPAAVARLVEQLHNGDAVVAGRAALVLGVAARRGGAAVVAGVPLAPVEALLAAKQPVEARYGGAYLLMTAKRPEALPALRRCLGDADADVRGLCAKAFGDVGGPEDSVVLGQLLDDKVPRVAAEAARSLAKLAATCSGPCTAVDALEALLHRARRVARGMETPELGTAVAEARQRGDKSAPPETLARSADGHAILALAQQGLPAFGEKLLVELRLALADAERDAASDLARADLGWLDCRVAAALDRQRGVVADTLNCGFGRVQDERRLALGLREVAQSQGKDPAGFAVGYLRHSDARVRLGALEVLGARPVMRTATAVSPLLKEEDLVVAGAAATTLGKLKGPGGRDELAALADRVPKEPGDLAEPVAGALVALEGKAAEPRLREWLKHPHANVRRVAAEALTQLTGQPVRSERVELPEDTFRPEPAPARAGLVLRTAKGDITVLLDVDEAPLTSGNLYALAKKGYFNGVSFHRVVPDFVAQGGDPRGDGEGGPGYSIRCEMTRRPYRRGTLGMALGGKDTGGSQFFFTHAPQPHLDGRYTAFGEVVSGMDVVDALLEGDIIREVRTVELP